MSDPENPNDGAPDAPGSVPPNTLLKDLDLSALAQAEITNKQEAGRHRAKNAALADAKYRAAVEAVKREGKASTAFVMREAGVDNNQAARIIDRMEEDGLIGLPNHVGERVIYEGRF